MNSEEPQEHDETNEAVELDAELEAVAQRRSRWITKTVVVVGGVALAAAGAVILYRSKIQIKLPEITVSSDRVGSKLDHLVEVSEHVRQQPYGPGRKLVKEIVIEGYQKGPGRAA